MSARRHSDNMLTTFVGNFYPALVALITGPILAHALGVFGRGQVAAGQAPLVLASTIASFGIPEAVTFAVASSPALARAAAARSSALMAAAGAAAMAAIYFASDWLSGGDPSTQHLILVSSLALIPTLLVGVLRGIASAAQEWRRVAAERMLAATMRLAVILVLWAAGALTPLAASIVLASMPLVGALAYIRLPALRRSVATSTVDKSPVGLIALSNFGGRLWLGSISGIVLSRIDQVLMTGLSSAYALGLYVVAVTVSELPLMINSAVRDVTYATDAARPAEDRLLTSARVSFLVCALIAAVIGATMWWWIPWLFGADFAASVPVAAILLVAVVIGTPGSVAGAGLSARGRPGLRSAGLIVAGLVNVAILVVTLPTLGAIGAALATLVGNLIASNFNILAMKRYAGTPVAAFYLVRAADVRILRDFVRRILRIPRRRGEP